MNRGKAGQGSTTACSFMPECDGKDQGEGSPKQACSYWFARHSRLATVARTSIHLGCGRCYTVCLWRCLFLVLILSFDFVIDFVIFLAPYILVCCRWISLFPSIYDIDRCATTAVSLVSGWVFTLWPRAGFLRSAYVRIQSINQSKSIMKESNIIYM